MIDNKLIITDRTNVGVLTVERVRGDDPVAMLSAIQDATTGSIFIDNANVKIVFMLAYASGADMIALVDGDVLLQHVRDLSSKHPAASIIIAPEEFALLSASDMRKSLDKQDAEFDAWFKNADDAVVKPVSTDAAPPTQTYDSNEDFDDDED